MSLCLSDSFQFVINGSEIVVNIISRYVIFRWFLVRDSFQIFWNTTTCWTSTEMQQYDFFYGNVFIKQVKTA